MISFIKKFKVENLGGNMKEYIIVAETGSDIPKELANKYEIYLVPMHVTFGEEVKDDGTFQQRMYVLIMNKQENFPKRVDAIQKIL